MWNRLLLGLAAVVLVIAAAYAAFYVAPEERTKSKVPSSLYESTTKISSDNKRARLSVARSVSCELNESKMTDGRMLKQS